MGKSIDLAAKPEKITDDQLQKIQGLVKNLNAAQGDLGILETRKHEILHAVMNLQQQLKSLQDELQEQYGTIDINVANGEIKYNDDTTDKKDNDR